MRPRRVRGPGPGHDFDAFVEARIRLLHRDAEPGEFVVPVPLADAEIDPPARQQVEGGDLLGQQHRIVPGQHQHRGAEAQGRGTRPNPGQQVQARRHLAKASEMVLDQECTDIAECLGLNIALNEFPEAGATVDIRATPLCLCTTEESKPHSLLLFLASTVCCANPGTHAPIMVRKHQCAHYTEDRPPLQCEAGWQFRTAAILCLARGRGDRRSARRAVGYQRGCSPPALPLLALAGIAAR